MRADLRWMTVLLAGGLMAAPVAALAQSTADPQAKSPPPSDTVGPSELQNFSLSGSATKPSDQQTPAPAVQAPAQTAAPDETVPSAPLAVRHSTRSTQTVREASAAPQTPKPAAQAPLPAPTIAPPAGAFASPAPSPAPQQTFPAPSLSAAPAPTLAPDHQLSIVPWVLAALFLAGAALFLLWRRRQREAFAGFPQFEMFVPPEPAPVPPPVAPRAAAPRPLPAPAPEPAAVPAKPAPLARTGIVSSRLRPSIEISAQPLRCLIEEDRVVLEFELELFNAGAAPARAVIAEASLFNAGANQEQELGAFFSNPAANGEPVDAIPPMKRLTFTNQVVAPRSAIQEYELGGRKAAVPVVAFNAMYQWSGGAAQTSAAFLVGRETKSDKLGPLALDRVPHEYRALGARVLPTGLRT